MTSLSQPQARQYFANWFTASRSQGAGFWNLPAEWDDDDSVRRLITGLKDDIDAHWDLRPDGFTLFASSVIADLTAIEGGVHTPAAITAIAFLRFLVSSAALRHAVIYGRPSLVFNWLLCSISDRPYQDVEPGVPVEITYWDHRPVEFLTSSRPSLAGFSPQVVVKWFGDLYYGACKFSLHHNLAELMLPAARGIIATVLGAEDDGLVIDAIEAATHLAAWLNQTNNPEAKAIALALAQVYYRASLPLAARKAAGIALSTRVGSHTKDGSAGWAVRTFAECQSELVQHEEFQLRVHSCATPNDVLARFSELLSSAERLAQQLAADYGPDPAAVAFRRSQLFDIVAPPVRSLVSLGHCREGIQLVAAWFGVPVEQRRRSPVLAVVPGYDQGALYGVDGRSQLFPRDTDAAMQRLTDAINHAFDLSIVLRHERTPPPVKAGHRPRAGRTDELAEATAEYYVTDSLRDFLRDAPVTPAGCFHPHAEHTPFQPLTERLLGVTWPIVTSFQEPQPDRPLRRVFLWSCGTILGGHDVRSVAAYLTARGVECVTHPDTDLTREQFLEVYRDGRFDAIWVNAHGMFDPREPHRAYIKLSVDGQHTVSVADMLQYPVPPGGRRLLLLNICLGGAVLVTASPACLGMGAMLAGAHQAVVGHISEVGSFVAPLFGALMAVGLQRTGAFFPAFRFAIGTLPREHDATLELLRSEAPECGEVIERLSRSAPGVNQDDIRTWGTPVFFE
jgi:hypothetical protein